uniref:SKA complex subunit 1 n=1 Tax=Caligus rogercresseyi TaxID=217165 RepID=C1BQC2_CALRO|nr:Spindle and kinetochore-associated protein 1 [Caligus rogercresseyi]|eukprot:TRINITY_DN5320_c0_g1_i1.p1 TRINITY_DN5320_c0_g1~~TRINITY_DN5320_c0_g1_i1.p1  ORF type:complete len:261 (-),score=74.33 TRINITY_DN5320_c0_g1_i1:919-1701(-)
MDRITDHMKDRLKGIEESKEWMSSGNPKETLSVMDSSSLSYASIMKKLEQMRDLESSDEELRNEAQTLKEEFRILTQLQKEILQYLPSAMIKSKDKPQAPVQVSSGVLQASIKTNIGGAKKPFDKPKKPSSIPCLTPIKLPEFDSIPTYMKGRLSYQGLNSACQEFNAVLTTKYTFLLQGFNPNANLKTKNKYHDYKKLETKDTKGVFFLVLEDFRTCPSFKTDSSRKIIFTILRHFKKMREIRGPGPIVRYAVVEAYNV